MQKFEKTVKEMVCDETQPIPLPQELIEKALGLQGESGCMVANYEDLQKEFEAQKLRYKVSEALSMLVSFEDDGRSFDIIEQSVKYLRSIVDERQNFLFGIKKVKQLSQYPVKILFSGILPINQLHLHIGSGVDAFINSDPEYFPNRFATLRQELSEEIGIPILPVVPVVDATIGTYDVVLGDPFSNDEVIAAFTIEQPPTKESLEPYLYRLFAIYKFLVEEKCYNRVIAK